MWIHKNRICISLGNRVPGGAASCKSRGHKSQATVPLTLIEPGSMIPIKYWDPFNSDLAYARSKLTSGSCCNRTLRHCRFCADVSQSGVPSYRLLVLLEWAREQALLKICHMGCSVYRGTRRRLECQSADQPTSEVLLLSGGPKL
jgi:hypothetical protein